MARKRNLEERGFLVINGFVFIFTHEAERHGHACTRVVDL